MKSIITGSTGFLGRHLASKLDDYIAIPHEQIQNIKLQPFDYFYFLSSYGNLSHQTDETEIFKANITDLISILSQVPQIHFRSFVYFSSSSVKLKMQTTYSRAKKAAEEILLAVMEKHNLPICIIRPFSITGYGEQSEHLIPTLINAAYTGQPVNLVPDATHDYIDVEDVVDGTLSLAEHGARGIYELGTGIKTSNQEVLEIVEKLTNKKIKVNIVSNMRIYDNENWVSNNFKARGYGWLPKKTLEESIKEQIDSFKRAKEEN